MTLSSGHSLLILLVITLIILDLCSATMLTASFMTPNMTRMTFMVNFDIASVICQRSANPEDLAIYPISALCNGVRQCLAAPNMDDESFPFCSSSCNPPCGPHGTCLMDGGKAQCYCDQGYSGKSCTVEDTNECAKKPCHWLAKCTNTYGSYYCSCLPGFSGDGLNCTDIDECTIDSIAKKCPAQSECSNVPGSYFCNCTDGFRPRGTPVESCDDIDECQEKLANCANGTTCVNTKGSYKCVPVQYDATNCTAGYEFRDGKCKDIDECQSPGDACAPRAICKNTDGGYNCTCPAGFTGDGKTCTPLTDCSVNPAICHPNAFCVSDLRMCLCQVGYYGDGISCFDMNECASDHSPCKPSEKCVNTNGSYVCCPSGSSDQVCLEAHVKSQCPEGCGLHAECIKGQCTCKVGFTGNAATECTDINECKENPSLCPAGERCVNFDGGYVCCHHGAPVSKCQGLVIGVWNKTSKGKKKTTGTPVFDLATTTPTTPDAPVPSQASLLTPDQADSSCSPSQSKYCELRSNKTCRLIEGHPECAECLTGFVNAGNDCVIGSSLHTLNSSGKSECRDPTKNDCHEHATCLDLNPAGHLCICKVGFVGNGKFCDDADECYKPNICSPNADCINQIGSFKCVCRPGFTGDGQFCTAVCPGGGFPHLTSGPCSEDDRCPSGFVCQQQQCCPLADVALNCESNPAICGDNAKCVDKQCVCDSGYTRNGSRCHDVNECAESVCDKSQTCRNFPGNFACCPGKTAQDKELCASLESNCTVNPSLCSDHSQCVNGSCIRKAFNDPQDCRSNNTLCHPHAECNGTNGHCYCSLGYIGDGYQCYPDPEDCFLNVTLCDLARSRCVDRRCRCLDGFHGNGTDCRAKTCEDNPSICHRNSECIKGQCTCKDGHVGNGLTCIPDPNDCQAYPTLCHAKASCKLRRCQCNEGFQGDGKTCTPLDAKNCQYLPEICAVNAFCNKTRCHCKLGYLGDGENGCWADPEDCVLSPSRCPAPPAAECIERRCKCAKGYVGNGTHCSLQAEQCPVKCHPNAKCVDQRCTCQSGFDGDGVKSCEKLETDCHVDASICHPKAECHQVWRGQGFGVPSQWRCKCKDGYEGDGRQCTESAKVTPEFDPLLNATATQASLINATVIGSGILLNAPNKSACADPVLGDCHPKADCVTSDNGKHECKCRRGFSGDGRTCQDINECALGLVKCHPLAQCVNTPGSHLCLCPPGYSGDGAETCIANNDNSTKDRLDVECQDDGIMLLYVDKSGDGTSRNFNGRIFVKTQSQNPYCSKDFTSSDGPVYKFKAPFAYCDVKAEPRNTFAVVVVIQKHPLFVTDSDEAYNLRCTYPVGELPLMSHLNVSMLATAGTYVNNGTMPQCSLKVMALEAPASLTNPYALNNNLDDGGKWQEVGEAVVGQKVQLRLEVEPKNLYGIIAKNCMAVNMDSGETYQLTNSRGCAVDPTIFPEWTQEHKYSLFAKFLTFKWPDTAHVRFQCDCSPCFEQCEPVQCGNNVGWGRKKRSDLDETGQESQSSNPVFSSVLKIRDSKVIDDDDWDDEHEQLDRQESNAGNQSVWLLRDYYAGARPQSEDVCIHSVVFASALALALSMAASVCAIGFGGWRTYRRVRPANLDNKQSTGTIRPSTTRQLPMHCTYTSTDTYRSDETLCH